MPRANESGRRRERKQPSSRRRKDQPAPIDLPRPLAEELARTARPGAAADAQRWMTRYRAARARNDVDEAYRAAVRAKQSSPRSPSVREAVGLVACDREKWHEAVQELLANRRLSGDQRHDAIIGECYLRLGRP